MSKKPKIAVVGGGPSGLFTAYLLNQQLPAARITILEGKEQCGGKLRTEYFSDGTPFEAGVAELYEYNHEEDKDPLRSLIEDDLELDTVDIGGGGYIIDNKILLDSDESEETKEKIKDFIKKTTENTKIKHDKDIKTAYHVSGGLKQVTERLLDEIDADICTSTRVTGVRKAKENDFYTITTVETDDETLIENDEDFDAVVIALPEFLLKGIRWGEGLADAVEEMCGCSASVQYLRVTLLFSKKWWKSHNLPGEVWTMDVLGGCGCYDESARWARKTRKKRRARIVAGRRRVEQEIEDDNDTYALSLLFYGHGAAILCADDQDDDCIADCVMQSLPPLMREDAEEHFVEAMVNRYTTYIRESTKEPPSKHNPDSANHNGIFLTGDYFTEPTVNGTLASAETVVGLVVDYLATKTTQVEPEDDKE